MKKVVKRFLLILPIIFCLVLGLAVPAVSSATAYNYFGYSKWAQHLDVPDPGDEYYDSIDLSLYTDNVFAIQFFEAASDREIAPNTLIISFSDDVVSSDDSTSNFIDISFSSGVNTSRGGHYVQNGNAFSTSYTLSRFTYDIDNCVLTLYTRNGNSYTGVSPQTLHYVYSNFATVDDSLNVVVEFQPELSGTVDRTLVDNGVSTESNFFNMKVTNNSRTNIQFRMAIVDSGIAGVSGRYHSETDRVAQDSLHYEFIRNENYYECAVNQSTPLKVYGNCAWHFIGSDGAYNRYKFSWSQMSLEKGKQYDVVVWAIPTNQNYCSLIHYPFDDPNSVGGVYTPYSIDFSRQEEVYRSTFTLSSSTVFNPDDDSFGNVAFKNGEHIDFDTLSSFVDENGQNHVGTFSLSDVVSGKLVDKTDHVYNGGHAGSTHSRDSVYNLNTGQFESISSSFNTPYSVNNLSASISNFGSFLQSIFSYFPSGVFAIFNLALVMVVIIAIIKVVR